MLNRYLGFEPHQLDYTNSGLELDYAIPQQIGSDRLANVLGALEIGYNEGVVVDFGTATTFDVFKEKRYLGV